ncbi:MAG: hypothetical protein IJ622_10170 [Bacteroidales bacterium]|nr:hypothetical protein [Bacteroidales bacterium]
MNITIDNYEAYLLDYVEGNLSPEGAAELRQFIAAQGLNWDELTEDLPYLEAPEIVYPDKSKLRPLSLSKGRPSDNTKVVSFYVKIASAAAAAGLLFTVGLWPEKSMPKVEPIADLMPIKTLHIDTNESKALLPRRVSESINPMPRTCLHWDDMLSETPHKESESMPLLAELSPLKAKETVSMTTTEPDAALEMKMEMLRYRLESDLAFAAMGSASFDDEDLPTSFIGRTIYRWSEGRYASVNDLVNAGLHRTKQEITIVTTEIAMEAQQRTEEHLADARDYWQEKTEKWK